MRGSASDPSRAGPSQRREATIAGQGDGRRCRRGVAIATRSSTRCQPGSDGLGELEPDEAAVSGGARDAASAGPVIERVQAPRPDLVPPRPRRGPAWRSAMARRGRCRRAIHRTCEGLIRPRRWPTGDARMAVRARHGSRACVRGKTYESATETWSRSCSQSACDSSRRRRHPPGDPQSDWF